MRIAERSFGGYGVYLPAFVSLLFAGVGFTAPTTTRYEIGDLGIGLGGISLIIFWYRILLERRPPLKQWGLRRIIIDFYLFAGGLTGLVLNIKPWKM